MLGWWWHPSWLIHVEAASYLPLSLGEGAVLGMGPPVVSVAPTEAELPRAQAAALGPCPAGALSSIPCTTPGSCSTAPIHPLPASGEVSTTRSISLSGNFSCDYVCILLSLFAPLWAHLYPYIFSSFPWCIPFPLPAVLKAPPGPLLVALGPLSSTGEKGHPPGDPLPADPQPHS